MENTSTRQKLRTPPDLKQRIVELYELGYSYSEIGADVGMRRNQIAGAVSRLKAAGAITEDRKGKPVAIKPKPPKPPPKPKVEPEVEITLDEFFAKGSSLLSLREGQCRFPTHSRGSQHLFCADAVTGPGNYCEKHRSVCWVKPKISTKKYGIRA